MRGLVTRNLKFFGDARSATARFCWRENRNGKLDDAELAKARFNHARTATSSLGEARFAPGHSMVYNT